MKKYIIAASLIFGFSFSALAQIQTGHVRIEQDSLLPQLLSLKTEMGKTGMIGDRYKIQIFSGDNSEASETIQEYRQLTFPWTSILVYETPNYKVWIGNFRNKLEADRALQEIKTVFPAAFRLRPERK